MRTEQTDTLIEPFHEIQNYISSIKDLSLSFYSGIKAEDISLLAAYVEGDSQNIDGCFTDCFGMRIKLKYLHLPPEFNRRTTALPYPSDGFHAESIEYVGVVRAYHESADEFVGVELGCGWGPWIGLGGVLARRHGKSFRLRGVEGSKEHCDYCREHMEQNALMSNTEIINALVSTNRTPAYFQTGLAAANNWGAKPSHHPRQDYIKVPSITVEDALDGLEEIDCVHVDIQGMEDEVFTDPMAMRIFGQKVKRAVIGTHSRSIEGRLFDVFSREGWLLEAEKPCHFNYKRGVNPVDMTTVDGCQIWKNTRRIPNVNHKESPSRRRFFFR